MLMTGGKLSVYADFMPEARNEKRSLTALTAKERFYKAEFH
jgi:hypothetical protein